jgi:hypothetical protein
MCAVGEVGEAPMRGNAGTIEAKATFGRFAQEAEVHQFGVSFR